MQSTYFKPTACIHTQWIKYVCHEYYANKEWIKQEQFDIKKKCGRFNFNEIWIVLIRIKYLINVLHIQNYILNNMKIGYYEFLFIYQIFP